MLLSPPRVVDDLHRRRLAALTTAGLLSFAACLAVALPPAAAPPTLVEPGPMPWPTTEVWLPAGSPGAPGKAAPHTERVATPRASAPEAVPTPAHEPTTTPAEAEMTAAAVVPSETPTGTGEGSGEGAGEGAGTGNGLGEGPGTGPGGGPGSAAPLAVHYSQAVPRHRVVPEWPAAARALGLHEARCVAHVVMDERGEPVSVDVRGCPSVFWPGTREAALGWRWMPFESGGEALRVQFDIAFEYRR